MESFNEWMDERGMSAEEASEVFAKSPGTIRNWRSIGVPESQREWVAKRIAEHDATKAADVLNRIVLEVTNEQFAAWNEAALDEGLLLKEWAIQTLDDVAADSTGSGEAPNPLQSLPRAAEDGAAYIAKKKDAAG
jgi:hypothetical protein